MADDDIRAVVPQHEHVIIDEAQFHAHQELRYAARAFLDGQVDEAFLRYHVEVVEQLTSQARQWNDADLLHHTKSETQETAPQPEG